MRVWLLRGAVLAVVHAAAQTAVAAHEVNNPTSKDTLAAIVLGALVGVAAVWGVLDTWRDVPRREMAWLIAALIAGWGAGVLGVIGRAIFVDQTGVSELGSALTGGAAFTALLVVVPAGIGMLVGKHLQPPRRRKANADDETEVEDGVEAEADADQPGGATKSGPRA